MSKEFVRILRVVEYIGEREWVEETLSRGTVPANGTKIFGDNVIRSATIGQFPEILQNSGDNQ